MKSSLRRRVLKLLVCTLALTCPDTRLAVASSVVIRDGRILEGELGKVAGLAENVLASGNAAEPAVRPILLVDDGLRRTFLPAAHVSKLQEIAAGEVQEKIKIRQRVASTGSRIGKLGPIISITPFDEFGRRIFSMMTDRGPVHVIQGITEITPLWTKVEGLLCERPYIWDMRLATSSIPRDTLRRVLDKHLDPKNVQHRFQLVRLFLQSERYGDAEHELQSIIKDFPDQKRLEPEVRALGQLRSRRIIDEVNMRREAGQHQLAYSLLQRFPDKDVAGETLQQVRETLGEYASLQQRGAQVLKQLEGHVEMIADPRTKERASAIYREISEELNANTMDRMADYLRLADDPQLSDDSKFAIAASGWLMGPNQALTNLSVVLYAYETRDLVRQYLSEPLKIKRQAILRHIQAQEGGDIASVARLIAHMKPPLDLPQPIDKPGFFELEIPGLDKEPNVPYYVQLPPEYDPHRRYPAVVTLNGAGTNPRDQIDWWAGPWGEDGSRLGQATRHGYIVIAVDWSKEGQTQYEFSAREHAAVLGCLRDACRRFAIDTDRVFLSGHSMGGNAAWDIALAHPDHWAGVIPIVAVAEKYCARYWENAGLVPFYVVAGELDGDKTVKNARDLDRYLWGRYDVTVVEYLGRGHEHFSDEIQRIFDWMKRRERKFFPKKFDAVMMRSWDNSFWWIELKQLPEVGTVDPADWPPRRGFQPVRIKDAKIVTTRTNTISIRTGADKLMVWLAPELVDFNKPTNVSVNGRRVSLTDESKRPNLEVLLEDVRTRGERQHPFWAKLEW